MMSISRGKIGFLAGILLGCTLFYLAGTSVMITKTYSMPQNGAALKQRESAAMIVDDRMPLESLTGEPQSRLPNLEPRHGVCRWLPQGMTSTNLWRNHGERIINATRANIAGSAFDIKDEAYPPWLEGLFALLHPRFLRLGNKNPPSPSAMKEIFKIIDAAILKKPGSRPLSVIVLGGSVTQGRGSCTDYISQSTVDKNSYSCNWPFQLQKLCDEFFGRDVIRVNNLSVGGTSTALSTTILKYNLFPPSHEFLKEHGHDVIINAYSTNDSLNYLETNHTYNVEWQKALQETAQGFIRASQQTRPCSSLPLVVYVDDYVGNQHNLILAENTNGWLTQEMSEWYGTMFISYASVVRRLVYANQRETILSAPWPWQSRKGSVEVHFGLSAHVAVTWVAAFSFLSAAVDFCDDEYDDQALSSLFPDQFPPLVFDMVERVLPPVLNGFTTIQTISDMWSEAAKLDLANKVVHCDGNETIKEPCAIAFVAAPSGSVRTIPQLNQFLSRYTQNTRGWTTEVSMALGGWSQKLGYVANEPNATTTFYKDSAQSEIRALKVHYIKSYGPKWEESSALFTLRGLMEGRTILEKSFTLDAFHNSNTSVSYQHELYLSEQDALPAGARVELMIQLISGTSFKIISLVICNRP